MADISPSVLHQVMVYNATAAILYLTAFATNAAYVHQFWWLPGIYDHLAAAAVWCKQTPRTFTFKQKNLNLKNIENQKTVWSVQLSAEFSLSKFTIIQD